MNSDRIEQLLLDADGMQRRPGEQSPADLASRVLDRKRSRARRRVGAGVAMLLMAGLMPIFVIRESSQIRVAVSHVPQTANETGRGLTPDHFQIDHEKAEFERLHAEIAEREARIKMLLSDEHLAENRATLARLRGLPDDTTLTERAAAVIVQQADRSRRETGSASSALRAYRQVVSYFPQTASASIARQRLSELKQEG